jgi:molybdopterin/thiamine biosynthesis adenylyltransferase
MAAAPPRLDAVLASRGFVAVERPRGFNPPAANDVDIWYHGQLHASRGAASVYLRLDDLSLVSAPDIYLAERPPWLQGWRPHLTGTDRYVVESLCYNDFEQYQLLAHDLGAAILRVLDDATETLNRISDPASVVQDSQREFARLWPSDFSATYIDTLPADGNVLECRTAVWKDAKGDPTLLVGQDPSRVARRLGIPVTEIRPSWAAIVFPQEGQGLSMTAPGPPNNLREVKHWLEGVAPRTHDLWHRAVQQRTHYEHAVKYCFFVTQGQVIGYLADHPPKYRRVRSAKQTREAFVEGVHDHPLSIIRLHASRIDDQYLVARNLPAGDPDLRGLRVLLIGAGAVGGFLACSLLKLGAGLPSPSGTPGRLTVCDRETLTTANIGRHVLGLTSVGKSKALEVCRHLGELWPGCDVHPIAREFVPSAEQLHDYDVVIDATGYETYSRFLSKLCRSSGWLNAGKAMLHVWIEGRGAVVRGLIQRRPADACYDCLWNYATTTEPRPRFPAYSDSAWTQHSGDGYATMTPFAISAPMAAAALGIDLLRTRTDLRSPSFVSRPVAAAGVHAGISKSPDRISKCPGCHRS